MLHTHLLLRYSYMKDKPAKPGNVPKNNAVSEIGAFWTENDFHLGFKLFYRAELKRPGDLHHQISDKADKYGIF